MLGGLFNYDIVVTTKGTRSTFSFPVQTALGFLYKRFVSSPPAWSMSFAKYVRNSKQPELTGGDSFNALVLPLLKSMYFFRKSVDPPKTRVYFDCYLTFGIGVVDAPMIGLTASAKSSSLSYEPWVRVVRHQTTEDEPEWTEHSVPSVIDVVHKDYFPTYMRYHLLPFAKFCASMIEKHAEEVASGKGYVKDERKLTLKAVESGLRPK